MSRKQLIALALFLTYCVSAYFIVDHQRNKSLAGEVDSLKAQIVEKDKTIVTLTSRLMQPTTAPAAEKN